MYEKQLGEKIKRLRNEKGLSQEKFALLIEMDRTYFASVESGKRNISLLNIEKIAKGFYNFYERQFLKCLFFYLHSNKSLKAASSSPFRSTPKLYQSIIYCVLTQTLLLLSNCLL